MLVLTAGYFHLYSIKRRHRLFSSLWVMVGVVACGYLLGLNAQKTSERKQLEAGLLKNKWVVVEVAELPSERARSFRLFLDFKRTYPSLSMTHGSCGMVAYTAKDDSVVLGLQPGDLLLVKTSCIRPTSPPKNPGEFNYAQLLARKGIFHQAFLNPTDWTRLKQAPSFSLYALSQRIRSQLIKTLQVLSPKERSVAEALLLGYKDHLDPETRNAYARSGALHVLAVSGLHVGIIYLALDKLLFFLVGFKQGRWVRILLILTGLWSYALLTGLPPSVQRAALMFSVIAVGRNMKKPNSVYNNVLFSAFVLLCWNPNLLFDVGFQLSYAAVLGIITLQPSIYQWFKVPTKVLDYGWQIVSVSLAAQLAVLPFSLFYFHQFPLLFPITNLVVIPAATIIIFGGIFLFLVSGIGGVVFEWTAVAFNNVLRIVNFCIEFISRQSFAVVEHLFLDVVEVVLLSFGIIGVSLFFKAKVKPLLWMGLASFLLLSVHGVFKEWDRSKQASLAVFSTGKTVSIGIVDNSQALLISNTDDFKNLEYNTSGFFEEFGWGFDEVNTVLLDSLQGREQVSPHFVLDWPFVQMDSTLIQMHSTKWQPTPADWHVLTNYRLPYKVDSLFEKVILTSNIYGTSLRHKKPEFENAWFVKESGAFVLKKD